MAQALHPQVVGELDVAEDEKDESSEVISERPTYVDASAAPVRERALQELTALAGGGDNDANDAAEFDKMSSEGSDILFDWTNARDDKSQLRRFDLDADMDADQIIATNGQCLELGYSSPSWSMFNRVPCFEHELRLAAAYRALEGQAPDLRDGGERLAPRPHPTGDARALQYREARQAPPMDGIYGAANTKAESSYRCSLLKSA